MGVSVAAPGQRLVGGYNFHQMNREEPAVRAVKRSTCSQSPPVRACVSPTFVVKTKGERVRDGCTFPRCVKLPVATLLVLKILPALQGDLQKCVDLMWSIETAGDDRYIFGTWLPATVSCDDQMYMAPIAYDTVVSPSFQVANGNENALTS